MSKNEFLSIKVRQVMSRGVFSIDVGMTAIEVAKLIAEHKIEGFPVMERGRLVGIVTGWDLLTKVIAKGADPRKVKAKDFMTSSPITCPSDCSVLEAVKLMAKHGIKRIPVVEGDKVVGIFTSYDVTLYRRITEHGDFGH